MPAKFVHLMCAHAVAVYIACRTLTTCGAEPLTQANDVSRLRSLIEYGDQPDSLFKRKQFVWYAVKLAAAFIKADRNTYR